MLFKRSLIFVFFLSFFNILFYIQIYADEVSPIEVTGDRVDYLEGKNKVVAKGNVVVTYKDIVMRCEKVTAYLDTKKAIAEGNVVVKKGSEILEGRKIIYDFPNEQGSITDGSAKADVWYAYGSHIEKKAQQITVEDGYITTCNLKRPHYRIAAKKVLIYPDDKVVAKKVTVYAGKIPIFFYPVYTHSIKESYPKVSFIPGRDKDWGTYLLSSARYNIGEDVKGNLHLDYRQNKGIAEGIDYSFKSKNLGQGYTRLYFMNERDTVKHSKRDRWRVRFRHKWNIRANTIWTAEFHRMSDRDFLKNYFYREEFERDPNPESYLSVIDYRDNFFTRVLVKKRVNRFVTQTQRLPELKWEARNHKLFEDLPIFYKGHILLSNLAKRFSDASKNLDVIRLDTYNQVSYPKRLFEFLSLNPYIGFRETAYSRQKDLDRRINRNIIYAGVEISSNFYKIFDYSTDAFGFKINRLRHILTPNINFFYIQKPSVLPNKISEFDSIDTIDKQKGFDIVFENKFQTKTFTDLEETTRDLARFVLKTKYLLGLEDGDRFTDIFGDIELRPNERLFIKSYFTYDPKWKDLESFNTDLLASDVNERWRVGLGHRYEEGFSSQLTSQFETKLGSRWKIRIYSRYEFKGNDFKEQEYAITRDLHCWEVEVIYNRAGAQSIWLVFRLKAFPELPFRLGTRYYGSRTSD